MYCTNPWIRASEGLASRHFRAFACDLNEWGYVVSVKEYHPSTPVQQLPRPCVIPEPGAGPAYQPAQITVIGMLAFGNVPGSREAGELNSPADIYLNQSYENYGQPGRYARS
jgi:hypothetical protein